MRSIVNMDFSPNKTPIEIMKEGALGGTCFMDMRSGTKIHGKNLIS